MAAGGQLTVSNTVTFGFNAGQYSVTPAGGFLTNNGTMLWASTTTYGYGASVIYNSGLWQLVSDGNLSPQFGNNAFINTGTLEKTGGAGTSTMAWAVTNSGVMGSADQYALPDRYL